MLKCILDYRYKMIEQSVETRNLKKFVEIFLNESKEGRCYTDIFKIHFKELSPQWNDY